MAIDVNAVQSFTDAELLKLVNNAIAGVAVYGIVNGVRERLFERASMADLLMLRKYLEQKVDTEDNTAASGRGTVNYSKRMRE
jgi:hypothetical protein